jgi:hypothetical protein
LQYHSLSLNLKFIKHAKALLGVEKHLPNPTPMPCYNNRLLHNVSNSNNIFIMLIISVLHNTLSCQKDAKIRILGVLICAFLQMSATGDERARHGCPPSGELAFAAVSSIQQRASSNHLRPLPIIAPVAGKFVPIRAIGVSSCFALPPLKSFRGFPPSRPKGANAGGVPAISRG